MELLFHAFLTSLQSTALDVAPIAGILLLFQVAVLRRPLPNLRKLISGFICVVVGLALFLVGLEQALFPIGETMASQLTSPDTLGDSATGGAPDWRDYWLVYAFAAAIGFATTVAEPSLIAVALKAETVSGGAVRAWGLRIAVAVGVAVGVALGCFRIVTGTPLPWYIIVAYVIVIALTFRSARNIVPLAYDSGGVTTSTVTVPGGRGPRTGTRGRHTGPESADRRVRTYCFCKRISYNDSAGIRHRRVLAEADAPYARVRNGGRVQA